MYLQDSNVHDDVRSLVHCKFNDDQGKIGLISFMKTVTADRGSWTKRQGERCLQRIKTSFGCCPCKLYVEQSLLFSLF